MKDLAGVVGEEKKYVTGIFFGCYGFFGGENVKKSPYPLKKGELAQLALSYWDVIQNFYELGSKDLCL